MISVLMTVYKEKFNWVKKAINSILSDLELDDEIILIVDNPEYDSQPLLNLLSEKDSRLKIYVNEVNIGLPMSLNKAFKKSKGQYIARMDADDVSLPGRFKESLNELLKGSDLVTTNILMMDENEKTIDASYIAPLNSNILKTLKYQNIFWHPTWLARREVFTKNDSYRNIKAAEDYDFLVRAVLNDFKLTVINKIYLKKRYSNTAISESSAFDQYHNAELIREQMKKKKVLSINKFNNNFPEKRKNQFQKSYLSFKEKKKIKKIFILAVSLKNRGGRDFLKNYSLNKKVYRFLKKRNSRK
ncbi:glycosyltransferase [Lactococcus lactis]|uniref:glycosyltransferase n=1 Tax=Lactococcus lactis TaxID=1358 RepID=UPI00129D8048|nr:glycosyltransferase [Lactococcus lactis]